MKIPYIGICDFTSPKQVERLLPLFPETLPHKLMVGVMMSQKTLTGRPSRWSGIFLPKEEIASIFIDHPRVMNTIHYADYEDVDPRQLSVYLERVVCHGGPNLHAIQLDMIWPNELEVWRFRRTFPFMPIVLQVGKQAMKIAGDDPQEVVAHLKRYGDVIDYVLLDRSMGRGEGMDAELLLTYADAIAEYIPDLGLAWAGGLGPKTTGRAAPLYLKHPNGSADAQSQLRPSGDAKDPIHWGYARQYLKNMIALVQCCQQ